MGRQQFTWLPERAQHACLPPAGLRATKKKPRSIGARDFGEEGAEFGGIFFAGAGLDAAGCVHGIGVDGEDGLGDIFRSEAAGEKIGYFLAARLAIFQSARRPVPP